MAAISHTLLTQLMHLSCTYTTTSPSVVPIVCRPDLPRSQRASERLGAGNIQTGLALCEYKKTITTPHLAGRSVVIKGPLCGQGGFRHNQQDEGLVPFLAKQKKG
ncbi:hypothetical protein QBC41DRAFT_10748 [Cercophora samala]|uniref:Uncharacterized protein n=1 Tax=Cercophora samala TaxID=330535 RepID=A0AA40D7E7_9PEZI|nr:hypothetical protein QBC41DRAFT_10748 [Cercophora samala]